MLRNEITLTQFIPNRAVSPLAFCKTLHTAKHSYCVSHPLPSFCSNKSNSLNISHRFLVTPTAVPQTLFSLPAGFSTWCPKLVQSIPAEASPAHLGKKQSYFDLTNFIPAYINPQMTFFSNRHNVLLIDLVCI